MKFTTISEGRSLANKFHELTPEYQDVLIECYTLATRGAEPDAVQCADSFDKMPHSIKTDILTIGLPNKAVEIKITTWLRNNYIDPLLR